MWHIILGIAAFRSRRRDWRGAASTPNPLRHPRTSPVTCSSVATTPPTRSSNSSEHMGLGRVPSRRHQKRHMTKTTGFIIIVARPIWAQYAHWHSGRVIVSTMPPDRANHFRASRRGPRFAWFMSPSSTHTSCAIPGRMRSSRENRSARARASRRDGGAAARWVCSCPNELRPRTRRYGRFCRPSL